MALDPKKRLLEKLKIGLGKARPVKAPTGTQLHCKSWYQEAALRMLCNNLDPDNGENPDELIVYGGVQVVDLSCVQSTRPNGQVIDIGIHRAIVIVGFSDPVDPDQHGITCTGKLTL